MKNFTRRELHALRCANRLCGASDCATCHPDTWDADIAPDPEPDEAPEPDEPTEAEMDAHEDMHFRHLFQ